MTIFRHEIRRNLKSQIIWALSISVFIVVCLLLYPKVEKNMNLMNSLLNGLNIFGAAIGWQGQEYLNMITYYGLEAGVFWGWAAACLPQPLEWCFYPKKKAGVQPRIYFPIP